MNTSSLSCCQCHGEKDRDPNTPSMSSTSITPIIIRSSRKELYTWYVYTSVCFYSFCSVAYAGLFYGWGSIADAISIALLPTSWPHHSGTLTVSFSTNMARLERLYLF